MTKEYSSITVKKEVKEVFDILYTIYARKNGYETKEQFAEAIIKEYIGNHDLNKVILRFE